MGKTWVSSDWHGAQWAWDLAQEFLGFNDVLFYLGDATDRGPGLNNDGGWSMLKQMLDDPRVVYLCGNHDVMLADAITRPNNYNAVNLCYMNGGGMTMDAAAADPEAKEVVARIRHLPRYHIYTRPDGKQVFMSHSGCTDIHDEYELIWDRNEYITRENYTPYNYVIHGHTRAQHIMRDLKNINNFLTSERKIIIPEYDGGVYWYSDWRATVDCGTVLSKQITFLNLDTFDEEVFGELNSVKDVY